MHRTSLDIEHSIHGQDAMHGNIAASLHQLGIVLRAQGKQSEAESMCKKSPYVKYSIHGHDAMHSGIAASPHELGNVLEAQEKAE